jgi:hypothetical protein
LIRWLAGSALLTLLAWSLPAEEKKPSDPKITAVYPVAAKQGTRQESVIRGKGVAGAKALVFEGTGIEGRVLSEEPPAKDGEQSVHVELSIAQDAAAGWHRFRLVTADGVTNELRAMVVKEAVVDAAGSSAPLRSFPLVANGRIEHPGDVSNYWIEAAAGETVTVEAVSGYSGLDPMIALLEESGSWFDPHYMNRLAFNDDPLPFPGLSEDARLVYRFTHPGKYCVRVNSFDGKGGPDYAYMLRISRGVTVPPSLHPENPTGWDERQFTRAITGDWLEELARRGGSDEKPARPETYRAVPEGSAQIPVVTMPALVEGRITKPGEAHVILVKVEKAEDLAIEVETPQATLPRFNPVIRLMQPDGHEMATDVYTKLNNNGLYMMKMIEAKTALNLQAPGEYTIAIRDITTNCAGEDFAYRVMVRKQIPHVGAIEIPADHVNLEPGSAKPVSIKIDREEGFAGYVVVNVKDLPPGVTALQAMENPEDKPPLPNGGRAERYFAKDQTTAVIFDAAADARPTPVPVKVRLELSVVSKGKLGPVFATREIPVMVVERHP